MKQLLIAQMNLFAETMSATSLSVNLVTGVSWMKTANLAYNAATTSANNLLAKKGMTASSSLTVSKNFSATIESAAIEYSQCQGTSETSATSIHTACLALIAVTISALSLLVNYGIIVRWMKTAYLA